MHTIRRKAVGFLLIAIACWASAGHAKQNVTPSIPAINRCHSASDCPILSQSCFKMSNMQSRMGVCLALDRMETVKDFERGAFVLPYCLNNDDCHHNEVCLISKEEPHGLCVKKKRK